MLDVSTQPKFLVDFMCGRLARWLRILGYDTEFFTQTGITSRNKILLKSLQEQRIILTRDTKLSKKKAYGLILITSDKIRQQVQQVVKELNLVLDKEKFFTICSLCNKEVVLIEDKNKIKGLVPPFVFETQEKFYTCPQCKRIYWQGTHFNLFLEDLKQFIEI